MLNLSGMGERSFMKLWAVKSLSYRKDRWWNNSCGICGTLTNTEAVEVHVITDKALKCFIYVTWNANRWVLGIEHYSTSEILCYLCGIQWKIAWWNSDDDCLILLQRTICLSVLHNSGNDVTPTWNCSVFQLVMIFCNVWLPMVTIKYCFLS